jgi:hypothetical protein
MSIGTMHLAVVVGVLVVPRFALRLLRDSVDGPQEMWWGTPRCW